MIATLWTMSIILLAPPDMPTRSVSQTKANPFAPSLPYLTPKEEAALDQIIDRFILFDTGLLKGEEGKKAQADFKQLGVEAIPALIRGMNKAAKIEHSCPAVTIAKKLAAYLKTTNDPELLEFARENIGAGVTQSRHLGVLRDLRLACTMRKRAVEKNPLLFRVTYGREPLSSCWRGQSTSSPTKAGNPLCRIWKNCRWTKCWPTWVPPPPVIPTLHCKNRPAICWTVFCSGRIRKPCKNISKRGW